jgi:HK97 family phage prohead protease
MDTRIFNSDRIQVRSAADGAMRVGGYAARFNHASKPIPSPRGGSFREVLLPTAFRNVLSDSNLDCVALVNHDANKILGRTGARTLRLSTDSLGLEFEVDLSPRISHHVDLYESVKRGDMASCSFAFEGADDEWDEGIGEYPVRTIRNFKALHDVSIVTDPAYDHTEVGIRSDVDLAEVRSRFVSRPSIDWGMRNAQDLIRDIRAQFREQRRNAADHQVVAQRHRSMMDLILS